MYQIFRVNKVVSLIPALALVFLSYTISSGQKIKRAALREEMDSILLAHVDRGDIPGAVVQIKKGKKRIHRQAYGYARLYDSQKRVLPDPEKMTVNHIFDLASLTKVIGTTTALMWLVDHRQISLDDPVAKYLEAFNTPEKMGIRIRHLLSHSSGLYEWYPLYYRASSRAESYSLIASLPLKYKLGEDRHYSDLGFVILGQLIERVSGMTLDQFMEQKIFKPLGMRKTLYNPLQKKHFRKIAATSHGNPYEKRMVYDSTLGFQVKGIDPEAWNGWRTHTLMGEVNDGNAWYANGGVSGAAGLFSTARDVQKVIDLILNPDRVSPFISKKTIDSFLSKDRYKNGLGWMMDTTYSFIRGGPEGSFGHTGFTGTSIAVIPACNISIVLLINRQHTGLSDQGLYYNVGPIREQVFKAVLKYCR